MNLLIPIQTETLVTQNAMPPKAADSAESRNGASFREHLDGVRTESSQKLQSRQAPQGKRKESKEKKEDEGSKTADNTITSDNPSVREALNETPQVRIVKNTDPDSGDNAITASSETAGQESDSPVIPAAATGSFPPAESLQAGEEGLYALSSKITSLTKAVPEGGSVSRKKEAGSLPNNSMQISSQAAAYSEGEKASEENALVQNVTQSSEKASELPDSVKAAAMEVKGLADGSRQRRTAFAYPSLSGKSGEGEQAAESSGRGMINLRAAGEKEPASVYAKMTPHDDTVKNQVEETVLPVDPKTTDPEISPVRKGEASDLLPSQEKPADKMHNGKSNNVAQASSAADDLSEGTRSEPNKSFLQSVKLEQVVGRKEAGAEYDLNETGKAETELTYQMNEKSGELFTLQDSSAASATGMKVVHQKAEVADISQLSRENFVITRKDNTSIELSIEPEGIGKLDIHLSLDKGTIHARINASENLGKDFIDRNMSNILQTLADEGINIGSFSISLRDRKNEFTNDEKDGKTYTATIKEPTVPVSAAGSGTINIYV